MSHKSAYLNDTQSYFHIYNRGVDRQTLFFTEWNYAYFLQRLRASLPRIPSQLIVYCLMPNHFHFVLRQQAPYAASALMKAICDGYAKAVNRWQHRTGHLFESRFKMKPVPDIPALLLLSRYIHRNPVAAGLVHSPLEWRFSSCRQYVGLDHQQLADPAVVLDHFVGPENYRAFLHDYAGDDRRILHNSLCGQRSAEGT